MNKPHLKLFLRGSAASMIGVGVLGIMNYLVRRTLALNLSEIEYGFFYSAFAVVMIALVFLDFGLGQSATILLSKSFSRNALPQSRKIFTLTFWCRILPALFLLAIMALAAPYLARYYFKYPEGTWLLLLLFPLILTQTLESTSMCVMSAKKAFVSQQILSNCKMLIIFAGVIWGADKYGIEYNALCFVIGSIIAAIFAFRLIKSYGITLLPFRTVSIHHLKEIFAISSWIAISTAGISLMYYMDTLCLTWLNGLEAVAMYNIALPIMQIAQSFFVFPAIFTPFVAEMWQNNDRRGVVRSCLLGSLLMLLTLPVFIIAGIYFSSEVISLLFDEKYIEAAPAVTILWSGMVFFSIANLNISALNSGNRQQHVTYMVIGGVLVNFILNIILIPLFSYTGAALATAITYVIMAAGAMTGLIVTINKK